MSPSSIFRSSFRAAFLLFSFVIRVNSRNSRLKIFFKKSSIKRDHPVFFHQALLKSRVMNKYKSSFATVGVWAPGAWGLESDVFTLSCLPAFLILIPVPVFPSFPSVFKNRGWFMAAQKKAKLPNEPKLKIFN